MEEDVVSEEQINTNDLRELKNYSELNCPSDFSNITEFLKFEEKVLYWIDGVTLCSFSIPGIIMNCIVVLVIVKHKSMHNHFNYLLICLFLFDSLYMLTTISNQSFMKQFRMVDSSYLLFYPYFTHPLKHVSMMCSIVMTVVLSYERYLAISYPIQHRIDMDSKFSRRMTLVKYILLVVMVSTIFNIPKFMEAEIQWEALERYFMKYTL